MPQLVTTRLAAQIQRKTAEHAYTDSAYYIPEADPSTLDDYGQPTESTSLVPVSCSFTDKPAMELWRNADIQQIDGEIRFATPAPTKGGKVRVTKRFGLPVTEKTYEIIGIQNRGKFGYVCALKATAI